MSKFKLEDLLVAYKGQYLKIDRIQGAIAFCVSQKGMYGLNIDKARSLIVKKAIPVSLNIKLQQIMK